MHIPTITIAAPSLAGAGPAPPDGGTVEQVRPCTGKALAAPRCSRPWRCELRAVRSQTPRRQTVDAVVVEDLRKSYGANRAVAGVSFTVRYGEIFSLLGPNGAGKTTVLEILEGYRQADEGKVVVAGLDPGDKRTGRQLREQIGLVLQELAVEPYLTVRESISRNAGYYSNPRDVGEVIGLVGLTGKEKSKVKSLSGGQKRRLDLALGIIGNPRVLFLDEPTTGFDPSARRGAWEVIRGLSDLGTTILLTTHYMDEAQELADRVAVISRGKIIEEGTPATLGGRALARRALRFALPDGYSAADLPAQAQAPAPAGAGEARRGGRGGRRADRAAAPADRMGSGSRHDAAGPHRGPAEPGGHLPEPDRRAGRRRARGHAGP